MSREEKIFYELDSYKLDYEDLPYKDEAIVTGLFTSLWAELVTVVRAGVSTYRKRKHSSNSVTKNLKRKK
jgi:hypothetical protein